MIVEEYSSIFERKKVVFVTGGVMSGLGKGTLSSSINLLLQDLEIYSLMQKADPYINYNAGLLSPEEHGEVFVCKDGSETDLDLGHYMRITGTPLSKLSSFTTGQIYKEIIDDEISAKYSGKTVQIVPHVTDAIINRIAVYLEAYEDYDAVVVEIGGTVGDIESAPFIESIRQLKSSYPLNVMSVHLSYIPQMYSTGEWKTKPTQHTVMTLRSLGVSPDIIVCRSDVLTPENILKKVALTCSVSENNVICMQSCTSIYEVPGVLRKNGLSTALKSFFKDHVPTRNRQSVKIMDQFSGIINKMKDKQFSIRIILVTKYGLAKESYKSLYEALEHAGIHLNCNVEAVPVSTSEFKEDGSNCKEILSEYDALIIPGGFGKRGWNIKKLVAKYCFENKMPCLGICYGLQAIVCSLMDKFVGGTELPYTTQEVAEEEASEVSDSEEKEKLLSENRIAVRLGDGKLRLGEHQIDVVAGSFYHSIVQNTTDSQIFRHRYIVNHDMAKQLQQYDAIKISAMGHDYASPDVIEACDHPWYIGVQFHPELQSTPILPAPIFISLVDHAKKAL